jgi:hypothetical protein
MPTRAATAATLLARGGAQLVALMERTSHELGTLFSAFVTARHRSHMIANAIEAAYARLTAQLAGMLVRDGWPKRAAESRAVLIASLLEGGAILSQAHGNAHAFKLALKHAQVLCAAP